MTYMYDKDGDGFHRRLAYMLFFIMILTPINRGCDNYKIHKAEQAKQEIINSIPAAKVLQTTYLSQRSFLEAELESLDRHYFIKVDLLIEANKAKKDSANIANQLQIESLEKKVDSLKSAYK
jgi:hypothetical protein